MRSAAQRVEPRACPLSPRRRGGGVDRGSSNLLEGRSQRAGGGKRAQRRSRERRQGGRIAWSTNWPRTRRIAAASGRRRCLSLAMRRRGPPQPRPSRLREGGQPSGRGPRSPRGCGRASSRLLRVRRRCESGARHLRASPQERAVRRSAAARRRASRPVPKTRACGPSGPFRSRPRTAARPSPARRQSRAPPTRRCPPRSSRPAGPGALDELVLAAQNLARPGVAPELVGPGPPRKRDHGGRVGTSRRVSLTPASRRTVPGSHAKEVGGPRRRSPSPPPRAAARPASRRFRGRTI